VITEQLASLLSAAVTSACSSGELSIPADTNYEIKLETPPDKQFGDFSSNLALVLKKATGIKDSRVIAEIICRHLPANQNLVRNTEVAGPGFINLFLNPEWLYNNLKSIRDRDLSYGLADAPTGERVLIEFVSANPTGPISVVNGRAAALGDVLGNLLSSQGCEVAREFYINDALNSSQLSVFARTVEARYLQQLGYSLAMPDGRVEAGAIPNSGAVSPITFPEKGYPGEYVTDIARSIVQEIGNAREKQTLQLFAVDGSAAQAEIDETEAYFRKITLGKMIQAQRSALEAFGVHYDCWFMESSLYDAGAVEATVATLNERGFTYTRDGALWLKSTEFGDTEDRVLIRSNEKATYIAADAAYHANKYQRGFTKLIDILGADHHGYVARLQASVAALGYDRSQLEIVITQMVSLLRDGEAVIGGKRKGIVLELKEDLIDDIGKDAARFYFLLNSYETPSTVDVELARRQSNENPVYYVQYAHARLCNILRKAGESEIPLPPNNGDGYRLLTHPRELDLLRRLSDYPGEVTLAAQRYAPHRLIRFAIDLAGMLNLFYENCRVLPTREGDVPIELTMARLALVDGARIVLRNLLTLLGVSAPDRMDRLDTNSVPDAER
jgi:arginyl-tRNA synthetase